MNISQRMPGSMSQLSLTPASVTDLNSSQMIEPSQTAFNQFCTLWKQQLSIPIIAFQKLLKILKQHITLKPQLQKRQKQLQILFTYNTKLIESIQKFREHEKNIIDRCNSLTKLYVKSFKKYFQSRNKQFDESQFKEMHSIFDTFSIQQWKVDPKQIQLPKVNLKYKQYLYNILKEYYIIPSNGLEKMVEGLKPSQNIPVEFERQYQALLEKLRTDLREYNRLAQTATIQNMFDILNKKRKIISQIKFFDLENQAIELQNKQRSKRAQKNTSKRISQMQLEFKNYDQIDDNFCQAVKKLHSEFQDVDPLKIKRYLQNEIELRLKLKKKQLKEKKKFQMYHTLLRQQNTELKEEIQQIKQKVLQLQKTNSQYKAEIQYLSIKTSMSRKNISQNMSVVFDETSFYADKGMKRDKDHSRRHQSESKRLQQVTKQRQKQLKVFTQFNKDLSQVQKSIDKIYDKFCELIPDHITHSRTQSAYEEPPAQRTESKLSESMISNKRSVKLEKQRFKIDQKAIQKLMTSINQRLDQFNLLFEDFSKLTFKSKSKNKVTFKGSDQNASVLELNHHSMFSNSENVNMNKTEIIEPPKMEKSGQAHLEEDSLSKTSSKKKNTSVNNTSYNVYDQYKLKVWLPPANQKSADTSIEEDIKGSKKEETEKKQIKIQNVVTQNNNEIYVPSPGPQINPQLPKFLSQIDEQSRLDSSKIDRNDNQELIIKTELKGSISLKYSANFNHNFTINSHESGMKEAKLGDNEIMKINDIHEAQSFAKFNQQDFQRELNNQNTQNLIKSQRIQHQHQKNKNSKLARIQSFGRQNLQSNKDKNQDKSHQQQIELTKSLLLETKIRDLQQLLQEKQSQLQRLSKKIQELQTEKKNLKLYEKQNILQIKNLNSQKVDSILHSELQKIHHQERAHQHPHNKKQFLFSLQDQNQLKQEVKKIQSIFHKIQNQQKSSAIFHSNGIKPILSEIFDSLMWMMTHFSQKNSHQQKKISLEKKTFIEYFLQSLSVLQQQNLKNEVQNRKVRQVLEDRSLRSTNNNKTVHISNHMKQQHQEKKKTPQKSKSNLSQEKSFHIPSQTYIHKNQQQHNMSSFKDKNNQRSISIVKKSSHAIKFQQAQGKSVHGKSPKSIKDKKLSSEQIIVAGVIGDQSEAKSVLFQKDDHKKQAQHLEKKQIQKHHHQKNGKKPHEIIKHHKKQQSENSKDQSQESSSINISSQIDSSQVKTKGKKTQLKNLQEIKRNKDNFKNQHLKKSQSSSESQSSGGSSILGQITPMQQTESLISSQSRKLKSKHQNIIPKNNNKSILPEIRIIESRSKFSESQGQKESSIAIKNSNETDKNSKKKTLKNKVQQQNKHGSYQNSNNRLQISSSSSEESSNQNRAQIQLKKLQSRKIYESQQHLCYTQQEYMELFSKYKAIQACLLVQSERNLKKENEYQSYLKQIKMKLNPYSKLTLEQRLFQSQRRIKQLQQQIKERERDFQHQIKTQIQQSEKLTKQFLIMLEKNVKKQKGIIK